MHSDDFDRWLLIGGSYALAIEEVAWLVLGYPGRFGICLAGAVGAFAVSRSTVLWPAPASSATAAGDTRDADKE